MILSKELIQLLGTIPEEEPVAVGVRFNGATEFFFDLEVGEIKYGDMNIAIVLSPKLDTQYETLINGVEC